MKSLFCQCLCKRIRVLRGGGVIVEVLRGISANASAPVVILVVARDLESASVANDEFVVARVVALDLVFAVVARDDMVLQRPTLRLAIDSLSSSSPSELHAASASSPTPASADCTRLLVSSAIAVTSVRDHDAPCANFVVEIGSIALWRRFPAIGTCCAGDGGTCNDRDLDICSESCGS